jgi:aminoglycoside phosphotransferase (APT) family kinase protein
LEDHWPRHESATVFNWGDSRIGNVMYRGFQPVAVLDWEMAGLGPPETDLAWLVYAHRVFEDMAAQYGFAGMPGFLRAEDVAGTYEELSGHTPRDLEWFEVYSALQFAIVFLRTGQRSVHFGEREAPVNADELIMNATTLRSLIGA